MKIGDIKKDESARELNWINQRNTLIREQLYYLTQIIKSTLQDFELLNQQIEKLKKKEN